jgi:hypothetical protein
VFSLCVLYGKVQQFGQPTSRGRFLLVRDVLEEAATRYGHCLEAYDLKLDSSPFDIERNRALTIGRLGPHGQHKLPIISMTLLT